MINPDERDLGHYLEAYESLKQQSASVRLSRPKVLRFCTYGHLVNHPTVHYRRKVPLGQVDSGDLQAMIDQRREQGNNTKDKLFINATTELKEKIKYKRERVFRMSAGSKSIVSRMNRKDKLEKSK